MSLLAKIHNARTLTDEQKEFVDYVHRHGSGASIDIIDAAVEGLPLWDLDTGGITALEMEFARDRKEIA